MPTNPIDTNVSKHVALAISFFWGTANSRRYVRWEWDVDVGTGIFYSASELEAESEKQHGGAEDVPYYVTIRADRWPVSDMIRAGPLGPYAHAPVDCEIGEMDPYDYAGTYRAFFKGRISRSKRNTRGLPNLVRLEVQGWKEGFKYPLGVQCTDKCAHVFGDEGCGVDVESYAEFPTVAAINGKVLTLSGITQPTPSWWVPGEISYDGLSLMIVDQAVGGLYTVLKPPPPEWLGKVVKCLPGCDKRLKGDCRITWNNESRFLGLGIKMPSHHPQLEGG